MRRGAREREEALTEGSYREISLLRGGAAIWHYGMARDSAEVRGRAKVRPYRVAQLIDTTSADEVRASIANLTDPWGGIYTPDRDVNRPFENIDLQGAAEAVEAVAALRRRDR